MENSNIPLISVLLPVYNVKSVYLKECIESILNQTFKNFELLILNDGSTKDIESIIKLYNDERIKYYKNEVNLGITKSRNKLLSLASGKYIAIADHDDISLPERLQKEYDFLENNSDISLVSAWIQVKSQKRNDVIWTTKQYPKILDFLSRCEIIHPVCMWRKEDFEKYNLRYDEEYYGVQDYELFSKAVKFLKFANIQEPLLIYRKHTNNASNKKKVMCLETYKVQVNILKFLISDKKSQDKLFKKYLIPNQTFLEKIFSIKNISIYKIISILGLKIFIKRFKTNQ